MNRFKNQLIATAVLSVLAVIGTIMNSHQAAAQQGPPTGLAVNIVNPLPVPVTGSTTVSGTVGATQSGNWNVGILGTPAVTVANNTAASPFSKELCLGITSYCHPSVTDPFHPDPSPPVLPDSFTVPSVTSTGASVKRLVITFISGECLGTGRSEMMFLSGRPATGLIATNSGDNFTDNRLPFPAPAISVPAGGQALATPTFISWDPGTTASMTADVAQAGDLNCKMQLNGYFATQ